MFCPSHSYDAVQFKTTTIYKLSPNTSFNQHLSDSAVFPLRLSYSSRAVMPSTYICTFAKCDISEVSICL